MFVDRIDSQRALRDPSWLDEIANYASTGGKLVKDAYGVYRDVTQTNQNSGVVPPVPEVVTTTHPDGGGAPPQPSGGTSNASSPSDGKVLGMEPLTLGLVAAGIVLAIILLGD